MSVRHTRRRLIAAFTALGLTAALTVTIPTTANAVELNSDVVISEVYGGGGNSGATYQNDFIELFNRGTQALNLTGWSVQYGSATGTTWQTTELTGSIPAGGFYLVQEAAGAGGSTPLPTPDAIGTLALSGTSGKVALVSNPGALSGCGTNCDAVVGVVDFIGYGTANDAAGSPAPTLSNTTSAQRTLTPFANTGNNAADFSTGAPTPDAPPATAPPIVDCGVTPTPAACVPGATTIQDVQGNKFLSPLVGTNVDRVRGTVTATGSQGFWIQQSDADPGRAGTSSGIFVFTSPVTVTAGDDVLVTGKVTEYYPLASGETLPTTSSLSTTELTPTVVTTLSKGNSLPAPLVLTPTTVPNTYAPTVAGGNIENLAVLDPGNSALEFYESHEGMLLQVNDARVVGPGQQQFGEIYVTSKPDQLATPRGGTYINGYSEVPTGRLLIAPLNGSVPPANVGDLLAGATIGPVDWSTFGGYDIAASSIGSYQNNGLTGTTATAQAADQLAVATYNVENLAPSDPQAKYNRLGGGVVSNLKSPDIISVEEIQDNTGATDDGVVAADATLKKLTDAIIAAGGPPYQVAQIDPVNKADGGQPGGNIRTVFLYNPLRVTFVSKPGGDSTTAATVSAGADGTPTLSVSPGRVDPANEAWNASRKPLVGEFLFAGKKVIVIGNHLNSKGGDQSADGRFQPPNRTSEIQRTKQATVLNGFVKQIVAVDPKANVVLAGDFNDYQFSGPIKTLTDDGALLTDLINTLPANQRYTYVFNGISQVLDHIFVSKALSDSGSVEYDVIHVNSEFSDQASDHDPQVVRIRPVAHTLRGTVTLDPTSVMVGGTVRATLAGWDPGIGITVKLDAMRLADVSTDAAGAAGPVLTIPRTTSLGSHTVSATTADGTSASAALQVTRYCVPYPGPHANRLQLLLWLLAVLTHRAC